GTLAAHVEHAGAASRILAAIRCVDDHAQAWALLDGLAPGESVLSADGLWLGSGWARRQGVDDSADSVLVQQRRREEAGAELEIVEARLDDHAMRLAEAGQRDAIVEQALEQCRVEERELGQRRQQVALEENNLATRLEHNDARVRDIDDELGELEASREARALELEEARERWQAAMTILDESSQRRENLARVRRDTQESLAGQRARQRPLQERAQQLALEHQRLTTERAGLASQRSRSDETRARLEEKCGELEEQREMLREPEEESRGELDELLHRRAEEERALNACRDEAQQLAELLRETEIARQQHERNLEGVRGRLEEGRMQVQALKLKADAQDEALAELGHEAAALEAQLDPNATESAWQSRLEEAGDKVRRLGAINLAAIEEYDQQAERRDYLEGQHAELSEALETLDRAIRKIDQETRTRFKQTFDQVNEGISRLFPKVFGGGTAWLTLTGEDLLETGVAIMARPPGKKNSTIHLLSGGEKALTALSLVFAIFQLNPAPFCMLDEVDAPLDDANVGRYAALVKDMSASVQFIYITHNKIAMEAADRLMGVTMQEPGVSRLVSVGVEQAAQLAEA
ncbi:MAG TPA: chromosome segregation protein SMC, partial [Modicisalibacter sp.]|nr:chromosome segregation protein SMC [Modicisalibacter sp.]